MNDDYYTLIQISQKFVPKGAISNKSALLLVMAWRQTDDKPLPEAMLTRFNHTCVFFKDKLKKNSSFQSQES